MSLVLDHVSVQAPAFDAAVEMLRFLINGVRSLKPKATAPPYPTDLSHGVVKQ